VAEEKIKDETNPPRKIDVKDLQKLKDADLVDLHDSVHGMLLRDEIGEEEFQLLRDQILAEMTRRGIRPTGETQRGRFSAKMKKILMKNILPVHSGFFTITDDTVVQFKMESLLESLKFVALRMGSMVDSVGPLEFSTMADDKGEALYDVVLVPHGKKVDFATADLKGSPDDISYFHQLYHASRQSSSAARSSSRKNRVVAGRFFRTQCPVRSVHPECEQKVDHVVETFEGDVFPVYVVPKTSSADVQVHKSKGRVEIWNFDGKNVTSALSQLSRHIASLPADDFVILGTVDAMAGSLVRDQHLWDAAKSKRDVTFFLNAYDCLYFQSDIHDFNFKERSEHLVSIIGNEDLFLRFAQVKTANSPKHLVPILNHIKKKLRDHRHQDVVLFEKTNIFNAVVLEVKETRIPGVCNFDIGVSAGILNFSDSELVYMDDKAYARVGETMSTSMWSYPGDIVEVSSTGIFHDYDVESDENIIRACKARVVNKISDRSYPFSAKSLIDAFARPALYFNKIVEPSGDVCYVNEMSDLNPLKIFKWEETQNEIRFRVRAPGLFPENSMGDSKFKTITIKGSRPRVKAIIGKLKGKSSTSVQALRFPKSDGWTLAKAQKWAEGREFRDKRKSPKEEYVESVEATREIS
jgi:hypothetical protein